MSQAKAKQVKVKREQFIGYFSQVWESLFQSPVHLDSALSKLPREVKPRVAPWINRIFLRPASEARGSGIALTLGEPWSIPAEERGFWQTPREIARAWSDAEGRGEPLPRAPKPIAGDFPEAMRKEWERDWGEKVAQDLVSLLGSDPPLSLRVSSSLGEKGPAQVLQSIGDEKPLPTSAEISHLAPFGIRIKSYAPVLNTKAFKDGKFEIQDEGSQVMAMFALWPETWKVLLQEHPGATQKSLKEVKWDYKKLPSVPPVVVDACAGAGGKTLALADAMGGRGRVFAYDTSAGKLESLKGRASRAGLRSIKTAVMKEGEEAQALASFKTQADVVLVDAPCSGWGVLRRNPDIKWRQTQAELERMPPLQLRILSVYSQVVKKGGRLVFGVCTFRKAETLAVVEEFLRAHPGFESQGGGYLGPGPTDGFFMHSFVRKE